MLKELFEGYFYLTFPQVPGRVVNLTERVEKDSFSLLDESACRDCRYVCSGIPADRKQLNVESAGPVHVIGMDEVAGYVKENLGEICDYMLESKDAVAVVEMTCSTSEYVTDKRRKARRQLHNTLAVLMANPVLKEHIERRAVHYAVFSWKETFDSSAAVDPVEKNMVAMTIMTDEVYSPDNASEFDFGFKLKEIRFPYALAI